MLFSFKKTTSFFSLILGAVVGFTMTNVTASEGESIDVCVEISSPNATVLSMSEISGTFRITTDGGIYNNWCMQ